MGSYLAGASKSRVSNNQAVDEILGVLADILPVPLVEDDRRARAFVKQVSDVLASEGRVATE